MSRPKKDFQSPPRIAISDQQLALIPLVNQDVMDFAPVKEDRMPHTTGEPWWEEGRSWRVLEMEITVDYYLCYPGGTRLPYSEEMVCRRLWRLVAQALCKE